VPEVHRENDCNVAEVRQRKSFGRDSLPSCHHDFQSRGLWRSRTKSDGWSDPGLDLG
jgi:hypothetical protein